MPRVRRRSKMRQDPHDTPRTRERLLTGCDWQFLDGPDLDDAQLQAAWQTLREELLAQHIRERPGTRPCAWWRYEAPEPRRQVRPGPEPVAGCPLWFGMPQHFTAIPHDTMHEAERDYLRRLRLLELGELP